jgi:hypothetical protein
VEMVLREQETASRESRQPVQVERVLRRREPVREVGVWEKREYGQKEETDRRRQKADERSGLQNGLREEMRKEMMEETYT